MRHIMLAVAFVVAASVPALAQEPNEAAAQDSMLNMMNMQPGKEMSEADRGYMKSMAAMQQNMMKMEMTGDPSGDFARAMIPHHQSAIEMVDVLLAQKDLDPAIKAMAEKMKADQSMEIALLKTWLESHPR